MKKILLLLIIVFAWYIYLSATWSPISDKISSLLWLEKFDNTIEDIFKQKDEIQSQIDYWIQTTQDKINTIRSTALEAEETIKSTKATIDSTVESFEDIKKSVSDINKAVEDVSKLKDTISE